MFHVEIKSSLYYYLPTLQRIIIGVAFAIGHNTFISAIIALVIIIINGTYVAVVRPFSDKKHNVRSICNSLCSCIIVIVYMMIKINGITQVDSIYSKLPYVIIVVLLLAIGLALAFVIKRILDLFKRKRD